MAETRTEPAGPAPQGEPKLVFRNGPWRGKVVVLESDRASIGRDPRNDIVLKDETVSARHAVVSRDEQGNYWIEDAGSKNGTFLNDQRIERATLREGDVFCLCQAGPEVQFTLGEPHLPSLLQTSSGAFARTRSLETAVRELLPYRSELTIAGSTAVRELLDRKLETVSRRSRQLVALSGSTLLIGVIVAFAVLLQLWASAGRSASPAPQARLEFQLSPVYGCLFYSYRDLSHSLGTVRIVSESERDLSGAQLLFSLEKVLNADNREVDLLVDELVVPVEELPPGAEAKVTIAPKFSAHVLSERTREVKAIARLVKDGRELARETEAVMVYEFHAFNWEYPERVAVFVDSEDAAVQAFVKAAWPHRPAMGDREFPPSNLVGAVTLVTALIDLGLEYRTDSRTPLAADTTREAPDRVSYPRETLTDRSGDCDDLSVLCCAVLEAAGIPTAFVVGKDHVLFVVDSGLDEAHFDTSPFDSDTVVRWEGRIWVPLESTELTKRGATFLSAWGAAWRWRDILGENKKGTLVDIHRAWQKYKPLNPEPSQSVVEEIRRTEWASEDLGEKVRVTIEELKGLYLENLSSKAADISEGLEGLARERAVAFLYAQNGLYQEAQHALETALFTDRVPTSPGALERWSGGFDENQSVVLHDLGLIVFLGARSQTERDMAAAYFEAALNSLPEDWPERGDALLRLALIHRFRGDREREILFRDEAFQLSPRLSRVYERLIEGSGSVAGPRDSLRKFLRDGITTPG